jgi:hypothetical protein
MAKHAAPPHEQWVTTEERSIQEHIGDVHRMNCKPRHSAGRYSPAELTARHNVGMAEFNARQSKFYETHDRTEEARGD